MKLQVKLIATYRKNLPDGSQGNVCEIDVPDGTGPVELLGRFDVPTDGTSVILVNGRAPYPDQKLKEGDVVCAFPAMAGG